MSRTIKDMPFTLWIAERVGREYDNHWREQWDWAYAPSFLHWEDWEEWYQNMPHDPRVGYCRDKGIAYYAREGNRKDRHDTKALLKRGEEVMPKYRRNARWLAS